MKNILFVCNMNLNRSPTAEALFRAREGVSVKSAGVYEDSNVPLDKKLLEWLMLFL